MRSDWKEIKFSELCDITRGASPRPIHNYLSDQGIPWVKIADATATDSKYLSRTREYINPEGKQFSVPVGPGDFILSNSATPGIPKIMKIYACIHDGWLLLRNFRNLDKNFAYWLLIHERKNLLSQGSGSVFTNLKTDILKNHIVRIPSIDDQIKISWILDTIANKIELNRQINQTLEQIAQAIFKSWFVDFDPVKAKIEAKEKGEDPERAAMCAISGKADSELDLLSPDQLDQLSKTASLFPDELEESELGMIPKGWRIYSLGNILEFAYGKALKEADRNGGSIPVFGSNGQVGWHDEKFVEGPGIVVGRKGNPGIVTWVQTDFFPIDTTFYVVSKIKAVSLYFIFHALQYHDLPSLASDSAVPGLNRNLAYMNVQVIPASELIGKFDELVEKIHSMISQNDAVISTLTTIRDTLLPKLLSGALKV